MYFTKRESGLQKVKAEQFDNLPYKFGKQGIKHQHLSTGSKDCAQSASTFGFLTFYMMQYIYKDVFIIGF